MNSCCKIAMKANLLNIRCFTLCTAVLLSSIHPFPVIAEEASDNIPPIRFPGTIAPTNDPPASASAIDPHVAGSIVMPPSVQQSGHAGAEPNTQFTHFRVGERNVKSIMIEDSLIWVGTSAGVIRYDTQTDRFRLFDVRTGLLANGVFHLSRLQGRLAVGTYGGGLALQRAESESWDIYNIPQGLADAFVYDVLETDNGDVWIATWSGANRVRGGQLDDVSQWETYTVENTQGGLANDWVYGLAAGRAGIIWLATEGGLARFEQGNWQNWNHDDGLGAPYELVREQIQFKNDPAQYSEHHARQKQEMGLQQVDVAYNPNYIVALLAASDGTVWCGTWGGGLAHFDGTRWHNFTVADGLPGNHIFMLHEDPQGQLWIGTNKGLARREDNGTYTVFDIRDGLYSDNVFAMATADDGSYWVGSFGGVARILSLP